MKKSWANRLIDQYLREFGELLDYVIVGKDSNGDIVFWDANRSMWFD